MAKIEINPYIATERWCQGPRLVIIESANLLFILKDDRRGHGGREIIQKHTPSGLRRSLPNIFRDVRRSIDQMEEEVLAAKPLLFLESPELATPIAQRLGIISEDEKIDRPFHFGAEPQTNS
jgi:hypothetical protein